MRVVVVASIFPPPYVGGAEKSLELMVDELLVAGHTVTVFALHPSWRTRRTTFDRLTVVRMRIPNIYWRWGRRRRPGRLREIVWNVVDLLPTVATMRLRTEFRRINPQVVITSNIVGWAYAPWKAASDLNIPLVHFIRDFSLLCVRSNLMRDGKRCASICQKCRPRASASLRSWPGGTAVGISQAVLASHVFQGLFDRQTERVVSHPNIEASGPEAREKPTLIREVGFLGRLSPEKGVEVLLEAGDRLGISILLAGEGHDEYVDSLRRKHPAARFLGHMPAASFLARVDLLVVPSVWDEPFGRVVADARAAGVPVLISDRGGLIEAAGAAAATFRSFSPQDPAALEALLAEALAGSIQWQRGNPVDWPHRTVEAIVRTAAREGE